MPTELSQLDLCLDAQGLALPHIDQYFGVWAVQEEPFLAACQRLQGLDLRVHMDSPAAAEARAKAAAGESIGKTGSVAVIHITGSLMKQTSSMSGGTSTLLARRQIRAAIADDSVDSILLRIDSPGGTVAGTQELADEVAAAAKKKPVYAQVEDLAASAAYWVASQAQQIFANRTALVGSIGTFMVIHDMSGLAAREGIKVHVLRAGDFKGAGQPGTEVTAGQLAEWQRVVNELNSHFLEGVAKGRKLALAKVRELADGRVHVGAAAQQLGLIDGVQSFDETVRQLSRLAISSSRSTKAMSETSTPLTAAVATLGPAIASYDDLVAACPNADEKFICEQLGKKATVDQARTAFNASLQARLKAQQDELDKLKAGQNRPGVEVLTTEGKGGRTPAAATGNAVADFGALVSEKVKAGLPRRAAVIAAAKADPDLHRAYLEATNPGKKQRELIADRFELE